MQRFLFSIAMLAASVYPVQAQDDGITVTLSVSPSVIDFGNFGGRFGAGVVRLSVSKDFNRVTGAEVSTFALVPLGGMTSIPGCVPGGLCETRSTPDVLTGAIGSLFLYAGESGFRAALGGGMVSARGGQGFARRSTIAGLVGADWIPPTDNRFAPTFSVRVLRISELLAGARYLLLPGLGVRF
jgi:hypothetical protein